MLPATEVERLEREGGTEWPPRPQGEGAPYPPPDMMWAVTIPCPLPDMMWAVTIPRLPPVALPAELHDREVSRGQRRARNARILCYTGGVIVALTCAVAVVRLWVNTAQATTAILFACGLALGFAVLRAGAIQAARSKMNVRRMLDEVGRRILLGIVVLLLVAKVWQWVRPY